MNPLALLAAAYVLAALVAMTVAVVSWRRRQVSFAAVGLALTMAGAAWWSLGDAAAYLLLLHTSPATDGLLIPVVMFGSALVTAGFTLLTGALRDPHWRPRPAAVVALAADPVLVLLGALAEPRLHLMVAAVGPRQGIIVHWTPGPLFWMHATYTFGSLLVVIGLLVGVTRHSSPVHRRQARWLLIGGLIPGVASLTSVATVASHQPLPELGGLAFTVTGLIDAYALFRIGLLRVVPVARGVVLDRLTEAVVVVDPAGRIIDANVAARRLIRLLAPHLRENLIGLSAAHVSAGTGLPQPLVEGLVPVRPAGGDEELVLDLRIERLADRRGGSPVTVVVARDVTELHRQRAELATANQQLRSQIATIEGLRAELAELAVRDELTGLHNRRYLIAALRRGIEVAQLTGTPLSVVVLDLDHFKTVNDTHGHPVGDALLAAVARVLAAGLRDADCVARYGGEEFVVVLPGTTSEQAQARAQEWRRRCGEVSVPGDAGPIRTTLSAGVAQWGLGRDTPEALLKAADEALYAAKAAGRNRVVLA